MKEVKEPWIIDKCDDIEAEMKTGNSKVAFDTLKLLTQSHQTRLTVIEDTSGNLFLKKLFTAICQRIWETKQWPKK